MGVFEHESYISSYSKFYGVHVILKTITRTRTLKGGGFGLTIYPNSSQHSTHLTFTHPQNYGVKTSNAIGDPPRLLVSNLA